MSNDTMVSVGLKTTFCLTGKIITILVLTSQTDVLLSMQRAKPFCSMLNQQNIGAKRIFILI